jgi:hypothetical protein
MGERAFAFLQGGLESSKGTAVEATRILMARVTSTNFNQPRAFVEEDRGTLVDAARFNAGIKDYTFTITAEGVSFEQLGWFLETASKGNVAPSTINTAAKRYVFSPNTITTGDDLQAATFQLGDDTQGYQSTYCEATSWSFGFSALAVGQAAPVTATFNYTAQSFASNTKTAGLSTPSPVTSILGTTGTWAIGTNAQAFSALPTVSGELRAFQFNSDNQLGRKVFVGDPNLTYSNIGRGRRISTFTATFEGDSNGVTRFVEWDLATPKRMRLTLSDQLGTAITGSNPATVKKLILDGQFYFTTFDPIGVQDTNTVYNVAGRFIEDATLATVNSDYQITLDNDQASYT